MKEMKNLLRIVYLLIGIIPVIFSSCNPVSSEEAAPEYVWKSYNLNKIYNKEIDYAYLLGNSPQNCWIITSTNFIASISYSNINDSISFKSSNPLPPLFFGSAIQYLDMVLFFAGDYNLYKSINGELTLFRIMNRPEFFINNITKIFSDKNGSLFAIGTYVIEPDKIVRGCILKIEDNNYKIIATANNDFTQFINIGEGTKSNKDKYYISSYDTYDHISYSCLYEFDGLALNKIYQKDRLNDTFINMLEINNRIYFAINKKLYSYSNNNFTPVIDFSTLPTYLNQIYGTSLNNLFLSTREALYQYTGNSLNKVYIYAPHGQIMGALIFENDVFFLARVGYGTPSHHFELIHGHLK